MKALTALTLRKPGSSPASVSRMTPVPRDPQSDVLFEMFNGALGSVHLARLLKGNDAGRLVTLRKLPAACSEEVIAAADLARSVAHPKLVKVLGVIEEQNARYLASEHIFGVTLFELGRAASNRQMPVAPAVAVRIMIDALSAVAIARRLLTDTLHAPVTRGVFPECIWIADFGETFLAEVLVAPQLGRRGSDGLVHSEATLLTDDVRSAALELTRMVCAGLSPKAPAETDISQLPIELQAALMPALGYRAVTPYAAPQEFLDALSSLDESLIATEWQVAEELQRIMGTVLNVRRQKLDMLERSSSAELHEDQGDETKFFRVAVKTEQRVTARPPPSDSSGPPLSAPSAGMLPAAPLVGPDASLVAPDQQDEPTMLFRRAEEAPAESSGPSGPPPTAESHPKSDPPLTPSLFQSAVHKRQSIAAQLARDSQAAPEAPAPAPAAGQDRKGPLLLALVGGVLLLAALRLGWLMHRDHVSLNTAWHEQTRALGLGVK